MYIYFWHLVHLWTSCSSAFQTFAKHSDSLILIKVKLKQQHTNTEQTVLF